MEKIPLERQRMFASAIHLAEHMHEAPVILLACTGTDFPTYAQLGWGAVDHGHAACVDLSGGAEHPARLSRVGVGVTLTTLHYFFEEELKSQLGIPADKEVAGLLPLGYPVGKFGPTSRASVEEVIHWGRWGGRRT